MHLFNELSALACVLDTIDAFRQRNLQYVSFDLWCNDPDNKSYARDGTDYL